MNISPVSLPDVPYAGGFSNDMMEPVGSVGSCPDTLRTDVLEVATWLLVSCQEFLQTLAHGASRAMWHPARVNTKGAVISRAAMSLRSGVVMWE